MYPKTTDPMMTPATPLKPTCRAVLLSTFFILMC
jgi:hypothetical protein